MRTYTREELTALTKEQLAAMTDAERSDLQKQGRAFLEADRAGDGL